MRSKTSMPGFSVISLVSGSSRVYSLNELFTVKDKSIIPQARSNFGFVRGFGRLGLDPLPPSCSECREECTIVSCGPKCRREECHDVCQSVPCIF